MSFIALPWSLLYFCKWMPLTSRVGSPLREHREFGTIYRCAIKILIFIAVRNSGGAIMNAAALGTDSIHADPMKYLLNQQSPKLYCRILWTSWITPSFLLRLFCTICAAILVFVLHLTLIDFSHKFVYCIQKVVELPYEELVLSVASIAHQQEYHLCPDMKIVIRSRWK